MSKLLNSDKAKARPMHQKGVKGEPESLIDRATLTRVRASESVVPLASIVKTLNPPQSILESGTRAIALRPRISKKVQSKTKSTASVKISLDAEEIAKLNEAQLRTMAKQGIKSTAFFRLVTGEPVFTLAEWAYFLGSTVKTLERRRKYRKSFGYRESERIIEVLLTIREGLALFHTVENFREWAHEGNDALGGPPPIKFMDGTFGIRLVNALIGRIKYGVYS